MQRPCPWGPNVGLDKELVSRTTTKLPNEVIILYNYVTWPTNGDGSHGRNNPLTYEPSTSSTVHSLWDVE